jgi:hypothetical protein
MERDRIRPKRVSSRVASRRVIRGVVLGGNALFLAGVAQYLAQESGQDFFNILSDIFSASLSYWIAEEALESLIFHRLDEASIWRGFLRFVITLAIWIGCDLTVRAALKAIPHG